MLDWDINDGCLMTVRQEVNWHPSHDGKVDLAIDYHNTNLKVETASK